MSNHIHLVLRSRPDVVKEWDNTEVARRWLMLCPVRRDENRQPEEPTEFELNNIRNDKEKVAAIRSRLSDISWWMRLLSQNIAQRANKEDQEIGKFWQARYRAVRLLDETAILACAAYVDLNPIRAAIAETIEDSDFTSAQKRARELQGSLSQTSSHEGIQDQGDALVSASHSARHLSPVDLSGSDVRSAGGETGHGKTWPCSHAQGQRCSDKGFLPMSTVDYLNLLDWTARQVRSDKQGATPQTSEPDFRSTGCVVGGVVPPCEALRKTVQHRGWPTESDRRPSLEIEHAPLSSPPRGS